MKLKRILSLLLSAVLVISGLPMTAFAAGGAGSSSGAGGSAASTDPVWSGVSEVSDELPADVTDDYVHLYAIFKPDGYGRYFDYSESGSKLKADKTYRLSFYIRGTDFLNEGTFKRTVRVCIGSNAYPLTGENIVGSDGEFDASTGAIIVPQGEWAKVIIAFKLNADKDLRLRFDNHPDTNTKNNMSYDIRDFSLYEMNGVGQNVGENLIKYPFTKNPSGSGNGWVYYNNKVDFYKETDFLKVSSTSDGSAASAKLSNINLTPGKYEVSAKFRLNTLDFNVIGTNQGGYGNSTYTTNLTVTGGSGLAVADTLALTTEWTEGKFVLDVDTTVNAGELSFALDNSMGFDISDFKITTLASYTDDYEALADVEIEQKGSADAEDYIYVYDVKAATAYPTYKDSDVILDPAKTYKLSFKLRTDVSSDANVALGYKSSWGDASVLRMTNVKVQGGNVVSSAKMNAVWKEHSANFTGKSGALEIKFTEQGLNELVPFAIADLSLVEVVSEGVYGNELIEHGTTLDNANGWSLNNTNAKLMVTKDTTYYTVPLVAGSSAGFKVTDDEVLNSGIYNITGEFRLVDFKIAKLDATIGTSSWGSVRANNNKAKLEVLYNGDPLKSVDGELYATVSTLWNEASFELFIPSGTEIRKSDITFKLDENLEFDFKNVEFVPGGDKYSVEFLSNGSNPIAKKGSADAEDYIYVYDVKAATAYPTYKDSSVELDATKNYKLSFKLRADASSDANEALGYKSSWGDASVLRMTNVKVQGANVISSVKISDSWKEFSTEFTGKSGALEIKFTEQGYDELVPYAISDISLIDLSTGDELIDYGTTLSDTNGWSLNGSTNAKLMVTKDTEYYAIPANNSGNTSFQGSGGTILESGIYHITGEFRLADYKIADLDREIKTAYDFVNANNNKSMLSVTADGEPLITVDDGASSVEVGSLWSDVSFLLRTGVSGINTEDIIFTLDDGTPLDFKNIKFTPADTLYIDSFASGDGSLISIVDEDYENYVHTYGIKYVDSGKLYYSDNSVVLSADKTYRISFAARTIPVDCASGDYFTMLQSNYGRVPDDIYRQLRFSLVDPGTNYGVAVDNLLNGNWITNNGGQAYSSTTELNGSGNPINYLFKLYDEWAEYTTLEFKPQSDAKLKIAVYGMGVPDILPYDIADFSIVEIDPNTREETELVRHGEVLSNSYGWSAVNSSVIIDNGEEYYSVSAPVNGENTSVQLASEANEVLAPGVYHITGKFRLSGSVDASKFIITNNKLVSDGNTAGIMAYACTDSTPLKTENGDDKETINPYEWTEVTFVLDLVSSIDMNTIKFALDGEYALDFCDIEAKLVEGRISMSDIDSSLLITLLLLKKQQMEKEGITKFVTLDGKLAENQATAGIDSYVYLYDISSTNAYPTYIDSSVVLDSKKTYQLTFSLRADTSSDAPEALGYAKTWGDSSAVRMANVKVVGSTVARSIKIYDTWKEHSCYISGKSGALKIQFVEQGWSEIVPFGIANLSLVDTATGEELIKYGTKINSDTGWSVSNINGKIKAVKENRYYAASATESVNAGFRCKNSDILPVGTWYVEGGFRLKDYKISNLTIVDGVNYFAKVTSNNNNGYIKAFLNGEPLPTAGGSFDGLPITTNWSTGRFMINVEEGMKISKGDIEFRTSDGASFYFKDIKFLNQDDFEAGLLGDAVSRQALKNWSCGGQSLEYRIDSDGTEYLAARNIINNYLGFTYDAGTILEPGTYIFRGDFRTANAGETGHTRIRIAGVPYTIKISNEWSHMEFVFGVDEDTPLEFILRGPTMATGIQEYDIANLSIVDYNDVIPNNVNLYEAGDFNNPETAFEGMTIVNSSSAILTHEQEDGNGFIRMSKRSNEYCGIKIATDIYLIEGIRYKLTYDIRCSVEGEAMVARSYNDNNPIAVYGETYPGYNYMYYIDHGWKHVEADIILTESGYLNLRILGGMDPVRDLCAFDVDNISIVKFVD